MRHSGAAASRRDVPSSKNARRYHAPSHACASAAARHAPWRARASASRARSPPSLRERREVVQRLARGTRRATRSRPSPFDADAVHAVVPVAGAHLRQAVRADLSDAVERARAMFVERRRFLRACGSAVEVVLLRPRAAARRETAPVRRAPRDRPSRARTRRRRTAARACRRSSACARRRRASGCHQCCTSPSTNWRAAATKQVLARDARARVQQREHVLQLIAEAVRAARLIEAASAPRAGSSAPDRGSQRFSSRSSDGSGVFTVTRRGSLSQRAHGCTEARCRRPTSSAYARASARACSSVLAVAEHERDLDRLARLERHVRLAARAHGSRPAADCPRAPSARARRASAREPGTPKNSSRSPVKLATGAVAARTRTASGDSGERVRSPSSARAAASQAVTTVSRLVSRLLAEHPLDDAEDREAPARAAAVLDAQTLNARHRVALDEDGELVLELACACARSGVYPWPWRTW